ASRPSLVPTSLLANILQFHVKDQGRVWRDESWVSGGAISEVARNLQLPLAANFHSGDALVPSLDDLSGAYHKLERLPCAHRAVELLAVGEPSGVVDLDVLPAVGFRASADLDVPILEPARGLDRITCDLGWTGSRLGRRLLGRRRGARFLGSTAAALGRG